MFTKKAFTLAEVLITLIIIGVLATVTLPSILQNVKKREVEVKLKKFYSNMSNATNLAIAENGDMTTWTPFMAGYSASECETWFNTYFADKLNVIDKRKVKVGTYTYFCVRFADNSATCFNNTYASSYNFAINYAGLVTVLFFPDSKYLYEKSNEAQVGKNIFYFLFHNQYQNRYFFQPYAIYMLAPPTREHLKREAGTACSEAGNKLECTALIQLDGWKIADDYPIKF